MKSLTIIADFSIFPVLSVLSVFASYILKLWIWNAIFSIQYTLNIHKYIWVCGLYFLTILFHWAIYVSLCQFHIVLITVTLDNTLIIAKANPLPSSQLIFLFKNIMVLFMHLLFIYYSFRIWTGQVLGKFNLKYFIHFIKYIWYISLLLRDIFPIKDI